VDEGRNARNAAPGWSELAGADEASVITALFEQLGRAGASTDALDVVTAASLCIADELSVIWPSSAVAAGRTQHRGGNGGNGDLIFDGIALRSGLGGRILLAPMGGRLHVLRASSIVEAPLGAMAADPRWVRVRARAESAGSHGDWRDVERRARLALASELVGVSHRILDVAVTSAGTGEQFRLAEAYAEIVGAQALVAAAWEDDSPASAAWAKAAAATAQDAVTKHVIELCEAIGRSETHELARLERRGRALDALLGSVSADDAQVGRELLAARFGSEPLMRIPVAAGRTAEC